MGLTEAQKKAGRAFRDRCQGELDALNEREPPGGSVNPLHRVVRHPCGALGGASAGIELREHYQVSPLYWVCYCSEVAEFVEYVFPHEDCQGGVLAAEAGLFCFVWKDGRCPEPDCGLVLRSARGIVDLVSRRPPEREKQASGR